jgi:hypothetical protein
LRPCTAHSSDEPILSRSVLFQPQCNSTSNTSRQRVNAIFRRSGAIATLSSGGYPPRGLHAPARSYFLCKQRTPGRRNHVQRVRSLSPEKPLFHVILSDRDEWAVEAEWPDGTLERVNTFKDYLAATDWVATQSEAWLQAQRIQKISMELKEVANALEAPQANGSSGR